MHISELRIRNFRNFKAATFRFEKGVNTLIGENGSGKTNTLYAIRLLLDENLSRNATRLRDTDFCRALNSWKGHWIVISADFVDLDPSEGCQLLKHAAGHMNGTGEGTYTFYFRPKYSVRSKLYEMGLDGASRVEVEQYLSDVLIDDYEPVTTGRGQANILDDVSYTSIVGDFNALSFPNPDDDDQSLIGTAIGPIHPEITCTFAQALRDVVADLRGYRSNPLLALLRGMESTIEINDLTRITNLVGTLNSNISNLPEIKEIASGIQRTLHATVGHTYSPGVSIQSALPDEIEKLLQRLTVTVGDDDTSAHRGELADQSLGGANLIYLSLKLLEYELKLKTDRVAHFLLIEEPEAHIHTHIQKTLFENQPTQRTQVILSTHSTQISSAAKIASMNVLARRKDYAEVFQPAAGLTQDITKRVERYLDAVRSPLLFAKGVVLVEVEAELVMLPALIRSILGLSPDEMGMSILSMDSAFFEHIALVFHPDRIRRRCAIVTDLDAAFITLPADPTTHTAAQKAVRDSQEAGLLRKAKLDEFARDNPWVRPFYANHTFEVDFLAASNAYEISKAIDDIYKRGADRSRVKSLVGDEDLAISGAEVLRIAKKYGKGWLGLLLAEQVDAQTYIPEYDTVIAVSLLEGYVPNWRVIIDGTDEDAREQSSKLLYVIGSRAKRHLHLVSERGHFTRSRKEYQPSKVLDAVRFRYDVI
jgi:putative ATP-dependent endonuclease of OLD family